MLPPAVALVVVATWLAGQRRSIATLERRNYLLESRLAAARSPDPEAVPTQAQAARNTAPIDWQQIAAAQQSSFDDARVMLRFDQRLQAMTREELLAALAEVATLDLTANARSLLEQMLIGPLIEKDPELVLARFMDRLQDEASGLKWHLPNALREWAKQDPAKAEAWLDQQIAAGKFASKTLDGKNPFRVQFEGVMLGILFPMDPAAAGRRLAALPQDQRADVVRGMLGTVTEADQPAFAQLVRDQVPAAEQAQFIANRALAVMQGGYPAVTEYLDRIAATPAERGACVEQVATAGLIAITNETVTRDDVDALREWAATQAPDATDRATGNMLAMATQTPPALEFNAAAALALQYSQASGNDDVLGAFLESWAALYNKDQARAYAANISDERRRAAILKRLE